MSLAPAQLLRRERVVIVLALVGVTAIAWLYLFLARQGMPAAARGIHREYIEAFVAAEPERTAPSSAATRYEQGG